MREVTPVIASARWWRDALLVRDQSYHHTMLPCGLQAVAALSASETNFTHPHSTHSTPLKSCPSPPLHHHLCPGLPPLQAGSPTSSAFPKSGCLFKYKPYTCDFQTKLVLRHDLELTQLPLMLNFEGNGQNSTSVRHCTNH